MTTANDVMTYIRRTFPTYGRVQRQKVLYYAQAWHLVWHGRPLYPDVIHAYEMGPVVEDARHHDIAMDGPMASHVDTPSLSEGEKATIDAVFAYYGQFTGTQLIARTHSESPWKRHYEDVPTHRVGREIIPVDEIRQFYTLQSLSGTDRPDRPQTAVVPPTDEEFSAALDSELSRWSKTLELLADR